jgi:hypothetical protein
MARGRATPGRPPGIEISHRRFTTRAVVALMSAVVSETIPECAGIERQNYPVHPVHLVHLALYY